MKVCLVNVQNCINYSQYGPFLFEHIKDRECVLYNATEGMGNLEGLYEFLVAEYNRNAFGMEGVRLIFLIPREMRNLNIGAYEFYNEINIYEQVISKLDIFSEIITLYVDRCNNPENGCGEEHRKCVEISRRFYSNDQAFHEYLPCFTADICEKKTLEQKVNEIESPTFKQFFNRVLDVFPEELEVNEQLKCSFANVFSSKCAELLPSITRLYELVELNDIADSITKTLKVVYFVKAICKGEITEGLDYTEFRVEHEEIKKIISTYKERMRRWYDEPFDLTYPEIDRIRKFCGLHNAESFKMIIDQIVDEQLTKLDVKKNSDIVEEVFERLGDIIENANDELEKFANKDADIYLDAENSYSMVSAEEESRDEIDKKNKEKKLLNELNQYEEVRIASFTEQIRLEQRLENINNKIQVLLQCREAYTKKAFIITFIFAVLGVIALYLGAQVSVFVKEKAFFIYGVYSAAIALGFATMYIILKNYYRKQIFLLLKKCKKEVKEYLDKYKEMAEKYEKNLNCMAAYACYKDFLQRIESREKSRESDLERYGWHRRKVQEILTNMGHFNDYINGVNPVEEENLVPLNNFEHDAEHTEFYQVKIF